MKRYNCLLWDMKKWHLWTNLGLVLEIPWSRAAPSGEHGLPNHEGLVMTVSIMFQADFQKGSMKQYLWICLRGWGKLTLSLWVNQAHPEARVHSDMRSKYVPTTFSLETTERVHRSLCPSPLWRRLRLPQSPPGCHFNVSSMCSVTLRQGISITCLLSLPFVLKCAYSGEVPSSCA